MKVGLLFSFVLLCTLVTATTLEDEKGNHAPETTASNIKTAETTEQQPTTPTKTITATTTGSGNEQTITPTTTGSGIEQTTTKTTYSILREFDVEPDHSNSEEDTHITVFTDNSMTNEYQDLYVEITSRYGEETTAAKDSNTYKFRPLKDGINFANPIKDGEIDISIDESVDINYNGIKIFVNDGNIFYNDVLKYPAYTYGAYREVDSIYSNKVKVAEEFIPFAVDTYAGILQHKKNTFADSQPNSIDAFDG